MPIHHEPSPRVAAMLLAYRNQGTLASVAREFGVTYSAVRNAVATWRNWNPVPAASTAPRRCLQCRKEFRPDARSQFMCDAHTGGGELAGLPDQFVGS